MQPSNNKPWENWPESHRDFIVSAYADKRPIKAIANILCRDAHEVEAFLQYKLLSEEAAQQAALRGVAKMKETDPQPSDVMAGIGPDCVISPDSVLMDAAGALDIMGRSISVLATALHNGAPCLEEDTSSLVSVFLKEVGPISPESARQFAHFFVESIQARYMFIPSQFHVRSATQQDKGANGNSLG